MIKVGYNYRIYNPVVGKNEKNETVTKFRLISTDYDKKDTINYLTFIMRGDIGLFHKQYVVILKIDAISILEMRNKKKAVAVFGIVAPTNG